MLDDYMLDLSKHDIQPLVDELKKLANNDQKLLLNEWAGDNGLK